MNVRLPPNPNLFCMNSSHKFHYFGIMKTYSFIFYIKKILKIGNFEKLFEDGILKIKFGNWNFGRLFENGILKNLI